MDIHEELENWEKVRYRMREEGIEYCFRHYSRFEEIEDNTFHHLRQLLIDAMDRMEYLVHTRIDDLYTKIEESE